MESINIVHWNKSLGPENVIQYPPSSKFIPKDIFLKIWANHELNKDISIIDFIPNSGSNRFISVIQKFEGEIYFLVITYDKKNKIEEDYHDILAIISKNLVELINTNKITRAISEAFNNLKNYAKLNKQSILMSFLLDKIKLTILKILRDGVISKSELTTILREEYGFSTLNMDLLLISFIREKLIKKNYIPGSGECYFLVNDFACMRVPPLTLPKFTNKEIIGVKDFLLKKYKEAIKEIYFNSDWIHEIENISEIIFLIDKDVQTLFTTLREIVLPITECLNILNNKEDLLDELLEKKFFFEAKGFIFLISDIRFVKFVPHYIIENLVRRFREKEISIDEYISHLKMIVQNDLKPEII